MPISEETIEAWEEKYDVDIAYDPEAGSFTVQSVSVPRNGIIPGFEESAYKVTGNIIDEQITVPENYIRAAGVEPSGDQLADLAEMGRRDFEESGGFEVMNENNEGFQDTPLHNVAIVAGALKTDGQIPPEVWAANPSFGGAGAGADILQGGGQGGGLSEIGIPHDIDHALGSMGYGPMAELNDVVEATGRVPAGGHGLGWATENLIRFNDPEAYANLQEEQRLVPATENFPDYVLPEVYGYPAQADGWGIQMDPPFQQILEKDVIPGSEGPTPVLGAGRQAAADTVQGFETYVDAGGDRETAETALRLTEDRYAGERAELIAENPTRDVADLDTARETLSEMEEDYGIV